GVSANADVDVRRSERCGELRGQASGKAYAEHVLRTLFRGRDQIAGIDCPLGDLLRELRDGLLDGGGAPIQKLLESSGAHRRENELRELAHVKTPGAGLKCVAVFGEAREVGTVAARHPRLLDGNALLLPFWRCVKIAESVGAELPFVADGDEEVGL